MDKPPCQTGSQCVGNKCPECEIQLKEDEFIPVAAMWGKRFVEMWNPIKPGEIARFNFDNHVIDHTMAKRIATQLGWAPKKEWVGLDDIFRQYAMEAVINVDQIKPAFAVIDAIEKYLKERNESV